LQRPRAGAAAAAALKTPLRCPRTHACPRPTQSPRPPATTGKFQREDIEPLLLRYLASIPAQQQPAPLAAADVAALPVTFPQQPVVEDVHVDMVSPITQMQISFPVVLEPVNVG
jgi:hypothetical protein